MHEDITNNKQSYCTDDQPVEGLIYSCRIRFDGPKKTKIVLFVDVPRGYREVGIPTLLGRLTLKAFLHNEEIVSGQRSFASKLRQRRFLITKSVFERSDNFDMESFVVHWSVEY